jgi:hypothetical protein
MAYCDNPANFFSAQCKEWIQGTAQDQIRNEIAGRQCAGSADPWCGCFSVKVPPEWQGDVTKTALLRCLDSKCEGGNNPAALKPYNLVCPTSYVDCQQKDIQLKLIESGIDQAVVQNKCGNIDLGGGSPSPSGSPSPGAPAPSPSALSGLTGNKNLMYGLIAGGVFVFILIIVLIIMAGKKKKPATASLKT